MPHTNKDQGKHFGHHKANSPKSSAPQVTYPISPGPGGGSAGGDGGPPGSGPPPQRSGGGVGGPGGGTGGGGGCGCPPPPALLPNTPGYSAGAVQQQPTLWGQATQEMPDGACFFSQSADFYSATTAGAILQAGIPILLCGNFPYGSRQRDQITFGYTHIALMDPMVTIFDDYRNDSAAEASPAQDFLAIPASQNLNFYHIVFCGIMFVPGIGKRKVLFLDRSGTPGSWPNIM